MKKFKSSIPMRMHRLKSKTIVIVLASVVAVSCRKEAVHSSSTTSTEEVMYENRPLSSYGLQELIAKGWTVIDLTDTSAANTAPRNVTVTSGASVTAAATKASFNSAKLSFENLWDLGIGKETIKSRVPAGPQKINGQYPAVGTVVLANEAWEAIRNKINGFENSALQDYFLRDFTQQCGSDPASLSANSINSSKVSESYDAAIPYKSYNYQNPTDKPKTFTRSESPDLMKELSWTVKGNPTAIPAFKLPFSVLGTTFTITTGAAPSSGLRQTSTTKVTKTFDLVLDPHTTGYIAFYTRERTITYNYSIPVSFTGNFLGEYYDVQKYQQDHRTPNTWRRILPAESLMGDKAYNLQAGTISYVQTDLIAVAKQL